MRDRNRDRVQRLTVETDAVGLKERQRERMEQRLRVETGEVRLAVTERNAMAKCYRN